ncbi:hypothetical protein ILUMI_11576 [Ignelater luminosus]|uniref:Pacifastin domain-containing protein n=1 Tax=Ignelater luminosus TaxID=2038154 RepID=A0A8K0D4R6_IGNLU|nr:hypothetical protein ILUMI_11576 [Ignelater luminosus]
MKFVWFVFILILSVALEISHSRHFQCKKDDEYSIKCNKCWCIADGFPVCTKLVCRDIARKYSNDAKQNYFYIPNLRERSKSQFNIKHDNVINSFFQGLKNVTVFENVRAQKLEKFVTTSSTYKKHLQKVKTSHHPNASHRKLRRA